MHIITNLHLPDDVRKSLGEIMYFFLNLKLMKPNKISCDFIHIDMKISF